MNTALVLDDLAVPLRALRMLAVDFPDLPAASVAVSTIFPNQLNVSFHDDFTAFEVWRSALGISADAVTYDEQSGGRTRVLDVLADFAGARVRLTGFSTHPDYVGGGE